MTKAGRRRAAVIAFALFVLGATGAIATMRVFRVAASSMSPTLEVDDKVVVNLMAYDLKFPFTSTRILEWSEPKVGDIVLFSVPNQTYLGFKRVAAVPGEVVAFRGASLRVAPDHYFVLGDSRDNSNDSRNFGPLPRSRIEGRLIWKVPRWTAP